MSYFIALYNLQDFGINSKQDMVNLYDNIIGKIVNPVKSGVGNFNEILELFRDGSIVDLFQNMLTTMTKLPSAIGNTTRWLKVLLKVILKTKPSTMVESVKSLLQQFKQMFSEIKLQIGNFYSVSKLVREIMVCACQTCIQCGNTIGPPAKCHSNGISLAGQLLSAILCHLLCMTYMYAISEGSDKLVNLQSCHGLCCSHTQSR